MRYASMPVYIGTSGWQYKHWRGRFYPRRPRAADDLAFYAERFRTVEINFSFYRLPESDTFTDWAGRVPDDFIFAVKASRYLTHLKRLNDPEEPVQRLMSRARGLGQKLGPVLLQLPARMRQEPDRLRSTLHAFGPKVRVAVEFRHDSWFTDEIRALLAEYNAALCLADRRSRLVTPAWRTADWSYIRFHGGLADPEPCYGRSTLADRARLIADLWQPDADVYAYFNNDPEACALRDASTFAQCIDDAGLQPSRVVGRHEVHVGSG